MTRIKFEDILRASGVNDQFEMPQGHLDQALKMIREKKRKRRSIFFIFGGLALALLLFVGQHLFSIGEKVDIKMDVPAGQQVQEEKSVAKIPLDKGASNRVEKNASSIDEGDTNTMNGQMPTKTVERKEWINRVQSSTALKEDGSLKADNGLSKATIDMPSHSEELSSPSLVSSIHVEEGMSQVQENDLLQNSAQARKIETSTKEEYFEEEGMRSLKMAELVPSLVPQNISTEKEDEAALPYNEVRIPPLPLSWGVVGQWGGYSLTDEISSSGYLGINMTKFWNRRWFSRLEGGVEVNYNLRENHSLEQVDNYGVEVVSTYYVVQPDFILSPRISLLTGIQYGRWELEAGPQFRFAPYGRGGIYLTEYVDGSIGSKSVLATGNLARNNTQNWTWGGEARLGYRLSPHQSLGISMIYQNEVFFTRNDVLRQAASVLDLRVHYHYRF